MYLQNPLGQYYKITDSWCYWVKSPHSATRFETLQEVQKAHDFYFNCNKKIKIVEV
jgi:hypothetical protein